jgi:hypothetical protein
MPCEMVADVRLPRPIVGQLHPEPDRDTLRPPALGRLADDPLPIVERRVGERRGSWLEVDVVRDGEFGDPTLERRGRVDVDGDVAVGRQAGMEMGIEGQVARLTIVHVAPLEATLTRR